jgi:PAS domain S-box-containing protein
VDLSGSLLEPVREDGEFVLYRARAKHLELPSVLLLSPVSSRPSVDTLKKIDHEYSLKDELDSTWAVRPLAISVYDDKKVLVLEDLGGEPLGRLIRGPMEIKPFLRLAIVLADAIGQLHKRDLIHKNVKPSNILVSSDRERVWLTGFGLASRLARERQPLEAPEFIAGTLAYMAPEQAGRMNRSIDSRSDLYALGVTLYELLTGSLPFTASDPMEWVHCHIARQPVPPHERFETVPLPVSAIVMKLLAKTPEERYQTAYGARTDLQRCLNEWESGGTISQFRLGENDVPDRLLIPEKLYGRTSEIEMLLASFERIVSGGRPELVLVSGYSGIGKSSVVNELHKALVPPRGLFASGKFDQYKRDIPYSTLAQAFQSLIRRLLAKSEAELEVWHDALHESLGPNAKLMVDLVPELKLIIGEQPPVPELPLQDAQRRFQLVFRRLIGVFARPEHPLALFLDDLQWLDAATLDLIEDLLTQSDVRHLMFIGAYRDNEVDSNHPLMRKLEAIRRAGATVQEIFLAPLTREDLALLITDSLHCGPDRAVRLAELMHEKTAGNPFFAIQFISALAEEGLLTFDYAQGQWFWDVNSIRAKGYTSNIVDLMVGKLTRLPEETQKALQLFACVGNCAEIPLLEMVCQDSNEEIHVSLWEAVRAGLIFRSEHSYMFLHDRVHEAAYSLIPKESRAKTHLRIGKLLVAHTPLEKRDESIFEIVNQLNRATALITSGDEREQLAELNLIAGKRSKTSAAYTSALTYLIAGSAALADDCWERLHELSFQLELYRAECEFLTGELKAAEECLTTLTSRAKSTVELAILASMRADLYPMLGQSDRAVAVCLDYLRHLGVEWSPHPTVEEVRREYEHIWSQLGKREIEDLIDLPLMSDPVSLATLDVLTKGVEAAHFTDENLSYLVICRMVNLSLEYGNSDGSCVAYLYLAMIAGPHFGDYQVGFRFGRVGYEIAEKRGLKRFHARSTLAFGSHVMPWTEHVRICRELLHRAFDAANRVGDLCFAAFSFNNMNTNLLAAGDPLAEVQRVAENGLAFAQKIRFGFVTDIITGQLALVRTLRGSTPVFGTFDDEQFDELRFERHLASDPAALPECFYWVRKLQARYFAADYASALDASLKAQPLLWTAPSNFEIAEFYFYAALCHAASWDSASSPEEKQRHFDALTTHHKQLGIWAENCPENFENRAVLVAAEIARIENSVLDAEHLYERAIHSAHANGFIHNEALANELAAHFYAAHGLEKISHGYLREAWYWYAQWGADRKVRQLEELHPHLTHEDRNSSPTGTIGTPLDHLDLATFLKVSQALSGEIVLEKLIDTLLRTALEHAGAERGLLILPRGTDLLVQAEATTTGGSIHIDVTTKPVSSAEVSEQVLHYAARTHDAVVLSDASVRNSFSDDEYIRHRHSRSILCVPLVKQRKLIALLYLENNLAAGVFTARIMALLNVLASAAAISLENGRLYRDLEEREARIRRLVDSNIVGIFIWDFEGRILEANDAFLHIVRYNREDLASHSMRWTTLTPSEWHDRDDHALADLRAAGSTQPYEKEFLRKDGSRVPVLIGGALFEGAENEGVSFVLDLTEQKHAADALRRSESYLAEAQRVAHIGSWAFDIVQRKPLYLSEEWYRLFGFDPKDGMPSWEQGLLRIHPDDLPLFQAAVNRAMREKSELDVEYRILPPRSATGYIRSVGHPVLGPSGEVTQLVGVTMDVTDSKQAEEERERLRRTQAELAHMNRVSTLGELTASLAHEIKQPIGAAVTNAEVCVRFLDRSQPYIAEAREAALEMAKDVKRAADIIDRVRSLFQQSSSELQVVDVNEVIEEMVVMLQNEANRHSVMIHTDLAGGLPQAMADRVQLQQVLMNLMLNGIEAMRDASGELRVKSQLADDGQLLISVADTGVGLSAENVDKIFDAFFTTKSQGTGLGLAITRSIVKSHGGQIWATSNSERGATFTFTLPSTLAAAA